MITKQLPIFCFFYCFDFQKQQHNFPVAENNVNSGQLQCYESTAFGRILVKECVSKTCFIKLSQTKDFSEKVALPEHGCFNECDKSFGNLILCYQLNSNYFNHYPVLNFDSTDGPICSKWMDDDAFVFLNYPPDTVACSLEYYMNCFYKRECGCASGDNDELCYVSLCNSVEYIHPRQLNLPRFDKTTRTTN